MNANAPNKTRVNLYGVVMGFSSPSLTQNKKSNCWSMTIALVDDSLAGDTPITLVLFRPKRDEFPELQQVGDVLRMHRVEAQVSRRRMVSLFSNEQLCVLSHPMSHLPILLFT